MKKICNQNLTCIKDEKFFLEEGGGGEGGSNGN